MALDESVFADYAAARGDFGDAPPSGIAGFPQGLQQAPVAVPQAVPQIQQTQELDTLSAAKNHPVFQFYDKWKKSSPEMRKNAEMKIGLDFPGGPRDMGLPDPTADVAGEAAARKEGKDIKQDKGTWGKFMKYIDSNPQFLLDLGARLLAPRGGGQSDLGFAVKGLSEAVGAASGRRAAEAKAGLEGQKTLAEIAQTKAETSKVPSEIELNFSKVYKNYLDAKSGTKKAAGVQLLDSITDSLWATGGGTKFKTIDEARLAGQRMISGKGSPEEMAFYDFMTENAVLGGTAADAQAMLDAAPSEGNIRAQNEAQEAAQQRAITQAKSFVAAHGGDRNSIAQAFVQAKNIPLTKALEAADAVIARAGGAAPKAAPKPAAKRTLKGDLGLLKKAEGEKAAGKDAEKTRKMKIRRWDRISPPVAALASAKDKKAAAKAIKEIEAEYESLSGAEQDKVLKIYNKLKSL